MIKLLHCGPSFKKENENENLTLLLIFQLTANHTNEKYTLSDEGIHK